MGKKIAPPLPPVKKLTHYNNGCDFTEHEIYWTNARWSESGVGMRVPTMIWKGGSRLPMKILSIIDLVLKGQPPGENMYM